MTPRISRTQRLKNLFMHSAAFDAAAQAAANMHGRVLQLANDVSRYMHEPYAKIHQYKKYRQMALDGDESARLLFTAYLIMRGYHASDKKPRLDTGAPAWTHTLAVGNAMLKTYGPWGGIIGFLHDALEDNPGALGLHDLRKYGYPEFVLNALDALTIRKNEKKDGLVIPGEMYVDYLERLGASRRPSLEEIVRYKLKPGVNYAIETKTVDFGLNDASDDHRRRTSGAKPLTAKQNIKYDLRHVGKAYLTAIETREPVEIFSDGTGRNKIKIRIKPGYSVRGFACQILGENSNELEKIRQELRLPDEKHKIIKRWLDENDADSDRPEHRIA